MDTDQDSQQTSSRTSLLGSYCQIYKMSNRSTIFQYHIFSYNWLLLSCIGLKRRIRSRNGENTSPNDCAAMNFTRPKIHHISDGTSYCLLIRGSVSSSFLDYCILSDIRTTLDNNNCTNKHASEMGSSKCECVL